MHLPPLKRAPRADARRLVAFNFHLEMFITELNACIRSGNANGRPRNQELLDHAAKEQSHPSLFFIMVGNSTLPMLLIVRTRIFFRTSLRTSAKSFVVHSTRTGDHNYGLRPTSGRSIAPGKCVFHIFDVVAHR